MLLLIPHISFGEEIEGRISLLYRRALLLDVDKNTEVISIKGLSREGYREGDWIKIEYFQEIARVKIAEKIQPRPLVQLEPSLLISTEELMKLVEKGDGYTLIDSRHRERYDEGYIPTAISIPDSEFEKNLKKLPRNKKELIVFYSDGPRCPLSYNSLRKALNLGYSNVKIYTDGEPGWVKARNYTFASLTHVKKQLDGNKPLLLIDTRPRQIAISGYIPGAVSIPLEEMRHDDFFSDYWEEPVVFYGENSGDIRSIQAAEKAISWNYQHEANSNANVNVLEGGFQGWKKAGYRVAQGNIKTSLVYAPRPSSGEITIEEFRELWKGKDDNIILLDVRSSPEIYEYDLKQKGAINIPYDELHLRISEIPKDKEIVAFCAAGYRAMIAYHILKKNGYKVRFLKRDLRIQRDGTVE